MGQCYAIPFFIEQIQIKEDRSCVICLENVVSKNIYVKCSKCNGFLHTLCALECKKSAELIQCPFCKRKNTLYIYDNDVYNCELL
jgi:hypothetical protein